MTRPLPRTPSPQPFARALVAQGDSRTRDQLVEILAENLEVVAVAQDGRAAIRLALEHRPDTMLVDVELPILGGVEACRQILDEAPETRVVLTSRHESPDLVRVAMKIGARDVLAAPFSRERVQETLVRLAEKDGRRSASLPRERKPGQGIWCFAGPKGGEGRTSLLLSMASELQALGRRVVVVDLDELYGDVSFYLGLLDDPMNLAALADSPHCDDPEVVAQHLRTHETGLVVLTGSGGEHLGGTDPDHVSHVVGRLEELYDYVLVDLPVGVPDRWFPLLDRARLVMVVTRDRPINLKSARVLHSMLQRCGYSPSKLLALLCRPREDARGPHLEVPELVVMASRFPDDRAAAEAAVSQGRPMATVAPNSPYGVAVRKFVRRILRLPE